MRREFRGEITALLSIVFVVMISFVGALIQSASIYISQSRKRADVQLALESVFAEYHRQAWENYDILIVEGADHTYVSNRLAFYGADGMTHQIQKIQLLSDENGQAFFAQAVRAMGGDFSDFGTSSLSDSSIDSEILSSEQALQELLAQEEASLPEEGNPLNEINILKAGSFLSLVHPNPDSISQRETDISGLASHRNLESGNMADAESSQGGTVEKAMFLVYLKEHFSSYFTGEEEHPLMYELEYILEGESSDKANLEAVAQKILGIRMGINYGYLLTDSVKKAEADALAATLTALMVSPGAKEIVKQALLLAWAYGESVMDLRILLKGNKVPIFKTRETWQLQLANLSQLGSYEGISGEDGETTGIDYDGYLTAFLLAKDVDTDVHEGIGFGGIESGYTN